MRTLFVLGFVSLSHAVVLQVPGDQPTIAAAFAVSAAGDEILVAPGIYLGNLVFPAHPLILRSTDGPQVTELRAAGASVVVFQSGQDNNTVLEGFTITGGTGTAVELNGVVRGGVGGGVFCRNGSSPLIRGNWIQDNMAAWPAGVGGGIFAWSSSPRIEHNWIRGNVAHYGGGIYLQSSAALIRDNIIEGNDTMPAQGGFSNGKGGGLRAMYGSPVVEGNTFIGNHCHWVGSAMAFSESGTMVSVARNLIVGNNGSFPIDIAFAAHGDLGCNLQWNNTPANSWPVTGYWSDLGGNGVIDPLFCEPGWPWPVDENSPCLPGQNPFGADCGWIGATREPCGVVVAAREDVPLAWELGAPWPNPFNPATRVEVAVSEMGSARLALFNLRGERVVQLHDGLLAAGRHEFVLDGSPLPTGLYLLVLEGPGGPQVRKVSLIR